MPKELIYQSSEFQDPQSAVPAIHLGWSKESEHVQMATIMPEGFQLKPTPEGNGWYIQLNRYNINKLIRTLRRARDAAYGADA